jgi:hypothetical protein
MSKHNDSPLGPTYHWRQQSTDARHCRTPGLGIDRFGAHGRRRSPRHRRHDDHCGWKPTSRREPAARLGEPGSDRNRRPSGAERLMPPGPQGAGSRVSNVGASKFRNTCLEFLPFSVKARTPGPFVVAGHTTCRVGRLPTCLPGAILTEAIVVINRSVVSTGSRPPPCPARRSRVHRKGGASS